MNNALFDTVVFDLGNVLIPFNPRWLFRKMLPDEASIEQFFADNQHLGSDLDRAWFAHRNISLIVDGPAPDLTAAQWLERVGLADKADSYPSQLSGGQQQRVAIARAVVTNPKLILADEPTGNLDSKNGAEVMNLLTELNKEGTTIIMVTHSQHDASFAHRTIHLFDGSVVASVAAQDL